MKPPSPAQPRRMSPEQAFRHALGLHRAGRLAETEQVCRQILQALPGYPDALHLLGVCRNQRGDPAEAMSLLGAVLAGNPDAPVVLYNLGESCRLLGRLEEALTHYERAIQRRPDFVEAHGGRGLVLRQMGRVEDALASYDRVVELLPDQADAHFNRAGVLQGLGRAEEALAAYGRALALRPDDAEAHRRRGDLLLGMRRFGEALAAYDRVLDLVRGTAEVFNNRGVALRELRRPAEAVASYEQATALRPEFAEAHYNRGKALDELGRPEDALAAYDRAIALRPDYAGAHYNRGNALSILGRLEDALASYERMLGIRSDMAGALGQWLHSRMKLCDWTGLDAALERVMRAIDAGENPADPFVVLTMPATPQQQLCCARNYALSLGDDGSEPFWRGERYGHRRIRLGYFSADFHNHPMAHLMSGLFEMHDRARFETYAFSFGPPSDHPVRWRLEGAFDHFLEVRDRSDAEIAALARELEIDIAIDRKGYTKNCRPGIFARRPAPVQVNYLAYPGTLGADWMDYLVADGTVIPPAHEACYSEKVVRLPHSYQVNDSTRAIAERQFRPAELGLPETGFVFCCFNNNYKITPDVFDVWMRLLDQVPGSVLWLLEDNPATARNLRGEAGKRGIDPARLVFAPRMEQAEHLARHRLADLFLDTFYYNAHTTASDALWAGLPVVTRLGESFAGRVAASLLRAIGLPELVTDTTEAYEALALELATDPARLAGIKAKLAANRLTEPLFDTALFTRHLEAAYVRMWERAEAGLPAQAMDIEA